MTHDDDMRTLGIVGGMSYHSTLPYYQRVNDAVAARLGGHHSAPLLLASVDFQIIRNLQLAEDWAGAGTVLADVARRLEGAGAQGILITTNLMHKVAPAVEAAVDVPLLHVADAVAAVAERRGYRRLGILGAGWTMRESFYADRLANRQIETVRANATDCALVDHIIFGELTQGHVSLAARSTLLGVIERLGAAGAEAVVLACTELNLILADLANPLPLIDSAVVHAEEAAAFVLGLSPEWAVEESHRVHARELSLSGLAGY